MSEVLLHYTRAGKVENIHRGDIVAVDVNGKVVDVVGDGYKKMFWRSAAKPFQALPFVSRGGMERFGLTAEELALLVSSHSGESVHVDIVLAVLNKVQVPLDALDCGAARPMSGRAAKALLVKQERPQAVHNACSGKHSGMLALGRLLGIAVDGYTNQEHEIQKIMHQSVADCAKVDGASMEIGIDGCGVPVFYLPIYNMSLAYARLANPAAGGWNEREAAVRVIRDAMTNYPQILAGTGRIDTLVSEVTQGRIIAKIGADAVYCLADVKEGLGITFKIEDGSYRAVDHVVIGVLKRLDLVTKAEYTALIEKFPPVLKNHRGDTIGTVETLF